MEEYKNLIIEALLKTGRTEAFITKLIEYGCAWIGATDNHEEIIARFEKGLLEYIDKPWFSFQGWKDDYFKRVASIEVNFTYTVEDDGEVEEIPMSCIWILRRDFY